MTDWGGRRPGAGSPITDDVGWSSPITPLLLIHLLGLPAISPNYYRNVLAGEGYSATTLSTPSDA